MKVTMAAMLALLIATGTRSPALAATDDAAQAMQYCQAIANPGKRLACYDGAARRFEPPTFAGRLSHTTKEFTIDKPHRLRYHSQGVVFVLYLKDANGDVLQNLNIAGGGTDSYLITEPGTYFLQINGSARWKIWLEPTSAERIHSDSGYKPEQARIEP